ncbi:MAG TPA: hypothetical protein VLV78_19450 [Thermoanaerobaculia bacterium]|nr:hypothetical protein [Thermoanaerobaculia bacterium]
MFSEPVEGRFGSADVALLNVSTRGAQVAHAQPLRLGMTARLWFKRGDIAVSIQALCIWSHLSKTPNEKGKYLYTTGLRIEHEAPEYEVALQGLLDRGVIAPDPESLEKKKKRELQKIAEKSGRPIVKLLHPEIDIPPDTQLLIEHARKQLLADPLEAQRWYQRAKYAITHDGTNIATDAIRNREDVLAVWEYLERSVDISTIAIVFERMRVVAGNQ